MGRIFTPRRYGRFLLQLTVNEPFSQVDQRTTEIQAVSGSNDGLGIKPFILLLLRLLSDTTLPQYPNTH